MRSFALTAEPSSALATRRAARISSRKDAGQRAKRPTSQRSSLLSARGSRRLRAESAVFLCSLTFHRVIRWQAEAARLPRWQAAEKGSARLARLPDTCHRNAPSRYLPTANAFLLSPWQLEARGNFEESSVGSAERQYRAVAEKLRCQFLKSDILTSSWKRDTAPLQRWQNWHRFLFCNRTENLQRKQHLWCNAEPEKWKLRVETVEVRSFILNLLSC